MKGSCGYTEKVVEDSRQGVVLRPTAEELSPNVTKGFEIGLILRNGLNKEKWA
jgi:hypothetical protein